MDNREKLTAIITTYNEAPNVAECIDSVKWADEVIVVDSFSDDGTVEIARSAGVRLLQLEAVRRTVRAGRNIAI